MRIWVSPRRGYTHHGIYAVRCARLRLGENRYHLLTNNCEHFCEWFIRGEHRGHQVDELSARCVRVRQKLRSTLVLFLRYWDGERNIAANHGVAPVRRPRQGGSLTPPHQARGHGLTAFGDVNS